MAESSITHNFIVSNPESVAKFAKALEEAAGDPPRPITVDVRHLRDPDELKEFMEKIERALEQRRASCPALELNPLAELKAQL